MFVIMDRGFPGVALWRAYTGAGAHLLIRARSCVAARPIEYLPDGTYLARMNLARQKRAATPEPSEGLTTHTLVWANAESITRSAIVGDAVPARLSTLRRMPAINLVSPRLRSSVLLMP